MKKNRLIKLNKFVCCLVILSLFLQFLPAFQLVRAEEKKSFFQKAGDWLVKLTEKVALPDITLTEDGKLNVGSYTLLPWSGEDPLGCAEWKIDTTKNPPVKKCIKPVNPFSQFKLSMNGKQVKSQIALVEPVVIPGCGEMTDEIWSEATDAVTIGITSGSISEKLSNDFITKKITGCTKIPCLESEETCRDDKSYKDYAGIGDRVNSHPAGTCYVWYMGGYEGTNYDNEKHIVMNKDNPSWRLYWELHLGETLGTYENIRKALNYYVRIEEQNQHDMLQRAADALYGNNNGNTPKYKNLREYASAEISKDPSSSKTEMEIRHEYYITVMTAMMPSLKGLASLNNITLNWWDARVKIKNALAILDAGKARDLAILNFTLEEIKTISAKAATLLEKSKASPQCMNPNKGELTIPDPYMPEVCQLSIPLPGDNKCEGFDEKCESKILAKNKACVYLNRLQQSASQEVYSAFKIFNATDPFTDCLFVKNCRTNCSLRIGELSFTVSLLDVAALFIPGGWLTVVQKILNIAKMINEAFKIYTAIKTALESGVKFLSDLFNVMGNLSTMYASFTNLGLNWSDMLIYGAGALGSQYAGGKLTKIGVGEGGNIGWLEKQGGTVLSAGDGLLGGVAAVTALNIDKVGQATNAMQDMLGNFAQNNLKFSAAKTAALKANEKLKTNVDGIRTNFKAEPEFSFFFKTAGTDDTTETSKNKKKLDDILNNVSLAFESVSAFLGQTAGAFQLKDGTSISALSPFQCVDQKFCSDYQKWYDEEYLPLKDPLKGIPYERQAEYCTQQSLDLDFSGVIGGTDSKCNLTTRVRPSNSCWLDDLKTMSSAIGSMTPFLQYIDPDYIKKQLVGCDDLACFDSTRCVDAYSQPNCSSGMKCYGAKDDCSIDIRNNTGARWRTYWENLAKTIHDPNSTFDSLFDFSQSEVWLNTIRKFKPYNEGTPMQAQHRYLMDEISTRFPPFAVLNGLELFINSADKRGWSNTRTDIDNALANFQQAVANNYKIFNIMFDDLLGTKNNLKTCVESLPSDSGKNNKYWENAWWQGRVSHTDIETKEHLNGTYPIDAAYEDWDSKIAVVENNLTEEKLNAVKEALRLKVSTESPIVVYKITQAQNFLIQAQKDAEALTNGGLASFEALANQIIDAIIASINETCIVPNQNAFDNYKNCCGSKVTCGEGWAKATVALGGLGASDCEDCKNNCKDCSATCEAPYAKCLVGAVNDSQAKATEQAFSMCGKDWKCYDDIYNSLYKTFYEGYSGGCQTQKETCQINCVGGFSLNQACIDNCNSKDGACGRLNFFQSQIDCFDANGKKYKQGYDDYTQCKADIKDLDDQRGDLAGAIAGLAKTLNGVAEDLKDAFNEMQKNWSALPPETSPENQESQTARNIIEKILGLKRSSKNIINISFVVDDKIDKLSPSLAIIKNIIDKVNNIKSIDEKTKTKLTSINTNLQAAVPALRDAIDNYIYAKIGPKGLGDNYKCSDSKCNNSQTFLCRLKCFEDNDIKRTFNELITYTEILKNVENAAFGLTQAGENIKAIEPSMDMNPVTIKPNLVDEIDERGQCCLKDTDGSDCLVNGVSKCSYRVIKVDKDGKAILKDPKDPDSKAEVDEVECIAWTEAKCKQKTSIFVGQRGDQGNYQFFKDNLLANPLSTLEDRFAILSASINNYLMPSIQIAFTDVPKTDTTPAKNALIKSNDVDVDETKYRDSGNNIIKQARYMWWDLIWGNETVSQELLPACSATEQILTNDPADIQKQCEDRIKKQDATSGVFVNTNLLPSPGGQNTQAEYDKLISQCKILSNIDLDVLENLQAPGGENYITDRIAELNKMRGGIGFNKVACPKWFCVNPETLTRGAGMAEKDPFCMAHCGSNDKPSDGFVCDTTNGIVWDTSVYGSPISKNPTDAICNGLGFNFANCTINSVDSRCQVMDNFLTKQSCNLFDKCSPEELQKQSDIKKWQDQSTANQCPKWFCLNSNGRWQGSAGMATDSYCQAHCGANDKPNDGMVCNIGIVWDTKKNPTAGDQIWPPKNVGDIVANQMVAKCIEAQKGLTVLGVLEPVFLDSTQIDCSPINPIISFANSKIVCENMKTSCSDWTVQKQNSNLDTNKNKLPMIWPPEGVTNYISVENTCISTQQEIDTLNAFKVMLDNIGGVDALDTLTNNCTNLNYQKDFARDCYNFSILQKALGNKTAINENWKQWNPNEFTTKPAIWIDGKLKDGTGIITKIDEDVEYTKNAINGFCRSKDATEGKVITETIKSGTSLKTFFDCSGWGDKTVGIDLTASTEEAQNAREVALKLCSQSTTDMRTPLNEIMKVFSVLLGVKSGTASMNGLSALYFDAQKIRQQAEGVIKMIQEAPKKFESLWNSTDEINKIGKDNFGIKPVKCIAGPMISYASGGKALTGANGGQVCPNVGEQFSQLDSSFSEIRQNLQMMYTAMIQPRVSMGFGDLSFNVKNPGLPDPDLMEVVWPIYERAKEIKGKSQLLWALATAINYANENCTCGQSYCPMLGKIPLCVSGLPLTVAPLKQPFCHLIWTLRYPLGSLAQKLKQELEQP